MLRMYVCGVEAFAALLKLTHLFVLSHTLHTSQRTEYFAYGALRAIRDPEVYCTVLLLLPTEEYTKIKG